MRYYELDGIIIRCSVGDSAIIELSDGTTLTTSKVDEIKGIWSGKFFFSTQNSYYTISGTTLVKNKDESLQSVYDKIVTVLHKSGSTLDTTYRPLLKRDNEFKYFSDMEDYFTAYSGEI